MGTQALRQRVLAAYGANPSQTAELLAYNHNAFDHSRLPSPLRLPLEPEAHVPTWEQYRAEAQDMRTFEALKARLVQFHFPIQEGISQTSGYRSATLKGVAPAQIAEATGLVLQAPDHLRLLLHDNPAGRIPVLIPGCREDFVTLVQACTRRNEPTPVPASMGACTIGGFNNWDRLHALRQRWEAQQPLGGSAAAWTEEFQRITAHKEWYQDRFMLISDGPYSNVSAADMGLTEDAWRQTSLTIRLEHECTHYFTRRIFGAMHNHMLDELIADYRGIVAAVGHFRADWFLRFAGLEAFPVYRVGGRLENYRGDPPLSDGAFTVLQAVVQAAAQHLERFDREQRRADSPSDALMLVVLTRMTLEELASDEAEDRLRQTLYDVRSGMEDTPEGAS